MTAPGPAGVHTRVTTMSVASADLPAVLASRDGVIAERPVAGTPGWTATFEQADGPAQRYQRRVRVGTEVDGAVEIVQEVDLRVGVPGFSWLFAIPLRSHTARIGAGQRSPWWAPPARLSRRAAVVLATLCLLSIVVGYVTDLLADTMTYAGGQFHVGTGGQGVALGVVEAGAVGALVLLRAADRRGRRPVLVGALIGACVLSAIGAAAPSLPVLTVVELAAASLVGAAGVLIGVVAVEEMPDGSRAWGIGLVGMCFGLGSGVTLGVLPLADLGSSGWRWTFVIALLGVPLVRRWSRALPADVGADLLAGPSTGSQLGPLWRRRLLVLGAGAVLLAIFASPASGFQNQFLHVDRHLSATRISLLEQLSGTIGGLGTLVGGRLADTWGRRPVAAIGVAAGTAVTLAHYMSGGAALWVWNTLASLISYAVAPALATFGAELFPAPVRARAGGLLTVLAAVGGAAGLAVAGSASSTLGGIAPALAVLAVAPAAVVVLIVVAYPETAGVPLAELNPASVTVRTTPG